MRIDPEKAYIVPGQSGSIVCRVTGDAGSVEWRRARGDIASKNRVCVCMI